MKRKQVHNKKKNAAKVNVPGAAIVAGIKDVKELAGMTFGIMGLLMDVITAGKRRMSDSGIRNTEDVQPEDVEITDVDPDLYSTNENL